MDVPVDVNFSMTFTSPFFQDFKNITQNKTSTIRLPLTAHNKRVVENSDDIAVVSSYPYKVFRAEYRENGLPVIADATAHLLKVTDKALEFTLTWGYSYGLNEIKDLNINQLLFSDAIGWNKNSTIYKGVSLTDDYFYPYTLPHGTDISLAMPWVKETFVVRKIFERAGFSDIDIPSYVDDRIIRLASRNKYRNTPVYTFQLDAIPEQIYGVFIEKRDELEPIIYYNEEDSLFEVRYGDLYTVQSSAYGSFRIVGENGTEYNVTSGAGVWLPQGLRFQIYGKGTSAPTAGKHTLSIYPVSNNVYWDASSTYVRLLIAPNLPPVNCIAFIKDWLTAHGLYPIVSQDKVSFITMDNVVNTPPLDYSSRFLARKELSYTIPSYVQRNIFTYKEDKDVVSDPSGILEIDNASIDSEKKMYESPYQEPREARINGNGALVFYMEMKSDEGASSAYENTTPYIGTYLNVYVDAQHYLAASFGDGDNATRGVKYSSILEKYYPLFQQMVRTPKFIKATFNLSALDRAVVNTTTPVYVRALGGYFIIHTLSIQKEIAEATMLRIPDSIVSASDTLTVITYDDVAIERDNITIGYSV